MRPRAPQPSVPPISTGSCLWDGILVHPGAAAAALLLLVTKLWPPETCAAAALGRRSAGSPCMRHEARPRGPPSERAAARVSSRSSYGSLRHMGRNCGGTLRRILSEDEPEGSLQRRSSVTPAQEARRGAMSLAVGMAEAAAREGSIQTTPRRAKGQDLQAKCLGDAAGAPEPSAEGSRSVTAFTQRGSQQQQLQRRCRSIGSDVQRQNAAAARRPREHGPSA